MTSELAISLNGRRSVWLSEKQVPWSYYPGQALSQTTGETKGTSEMKKEKKKGCLLARLGRCTEGKQENRLHKDPKI